MAPTLRARCPRPERPTNPTVGDLAAFSVRQEGAESVCEVRKDAAVAVIDAFNTAAAQLAVMLAPRPWWRWW